MKQTRIMVANVHVPLLILGAGYAGLGAGIEAQRRGIDSCILELQNRPGGLCRNTSIHGCDFDYGPKILLLHDSPDAADMLQFLGTNYEQYPVSESMYLSQYGMLHFPLQRYLIDLPPAERTHALNDLLEARQHPHAIASYSDWLLSCYGRYLCQNVLFPYEEKKWQRPLDTLDYMWALSRPVKVGLDEIQEGATRLLPPSKSYYYPKYGNIATLSNAMAKQAGPIQYNQSITAIDPVAKTVTTADATYSYDTLLSTIPIDDLMAMTRDIPQALHDRVPETLQRLGIRVFNIVFAGNHDISGTAIYFAEKKFIFRRVSILQNLCPALARDGVTPISVEVSLPANGPVPSEEEQLEMILQQLREIPDFEPLTTVLAHEVLPINFAYPIQTNGLRSFVHDVHDYYAQYDIYHCGRGGNFDYCNSDVAYTQGKQAVAHIAARSSIV